MLSELITTIGGADANSYASLTEADNYFAGRFVSGEGWSGLTNDQKTARLLQAAMVLDRLQYVGEQVSDTQRLAWPRKSNEELGYYSSPLRVLGKSIATDEIPVAIKYAQCELALIIFDDDGQVLGDSSQAIRSETLGKWSISYVQQWLPIACPAVMDYLYPFLVESTRINRA